jgi:hypothetical protein
MPRDLQRLDRSQVGVDLPLKLVGPLLEFLNLVLGFGLFLGQSFDPLDFSRAPSGFLEVEVVGHRRPRGPRV